MKNKIILCCMILLTLSGCGKKVTVESGRVAKELGSTGLEKRIRSAGAFRLDSCILSACSSLVVLEAFENTQKIKSKYYISASKLNLELEVSIVYAVKTDDNSINKVYERVKSVKTESRGSIITSERIFDTYVNPIGIGNIRTSLNNYNIDEIMDNLSEVNDYVQSEFIKKLENEPVVIKSLTFSFVSYPEVIVSRREEEASVDAEKSTKLKRLEANLIIVKERKKLDIQRATVAVEAARIVSESMDAKMQVWLMLEVLQTCAERTVGDCNIDIHPSLLPRL